ncbi:MAG TPA: ABC transporter ATP-binding protein, partial [Chitinophagaceae bacterium]|nr:ABC transporter ATP-binding protein [Chitinophagaceae bacterium]
LNKYFWKYKVRLTIGIFFILISNYFGVLAPQVTGFVIDFVQRALKLPGYRPKTGTANYDILVQQFIYKIESLQLSVGNVVAICGITILVLALLRGLFLFFMRQTIIVMSRHIEYDQKNEVFDHYQKLDTAFYKTHSTGDLMSRMAEDVSRVRMFTGPAIMYLINLVALISLSVFFMFKRSPELTLYVLAPLPLLAITIYLVNNIIHKKSEQVQANLAAITTDAQQSYAGIRVIKSFVQEENMLRHFEENSEHYRRNAVSLAKVEALYFPSMGLFIGLSTLLTIMIGGISFINGTGNITLPVIVEFVIYINLLTFPVSAIGWTASMIQRASSSQKRLNEFLHTTSQIRKKENLLKPTLNGAITFKNVDFHYPDTNIHALKNFSLHINAGDKIAVVGRTGSGKTTIGQLLLHMYNVDSGSIQFDKNDIEQIDSDSLHQQISYVPQDGFLFSDTVQNNIAFGAPKATEKEVQEAAKMASIHKEILTFPKGYETMIGERGVNLSGGQKQRISIARAFMKKAPILLLDDCLSAVDARTEKEIMSQLNYFLQEKTAIIITHRIFSLIQFDKIIVLQEGKMIEQGTHAALLNLNGVYAEMYAKQLLEDDTNNDATNLAVHKT